MAAGKSGGGGAGEITFLEALARSESKKDGGYKNNWSFDHGEESEGDTDKEKEYPPHVQKFENNPIRLSRPQGVDRIMKKTEESESHLESEIKRKVPQKRHSSTYHCTPSPLSPASKKCLTDLEFSEQCDYCPKCGENKENQTKCQTCGILFPKDLQRNCRQAVTLNEPTGPLLRTSIHQNSGGQKSQNTAVPPKKFYGNSVGKIPMDIILNCDDNRQHLQTNGKVILPRSKGVKITSLKERKTSLSDLNDPIILSSDDDDDDNDRTNRRESISPQPADSACSSPAPSTGKVEAALNENTCRVEHEPRSIPADSELNTVTLPRKARMKDQFGNSIINTPLKRRKVISQETLVDPVSLSCQSSFDSVILNCRSIRVGTLFRLLIEPVIQNLQKSTIGTNLSYFSVLFRFYQDTARRIDSFSVSICFPPEPENDPVGITLNTSDLTKCEWCNVRKLPVVFLQTIPAVYQKLSMQLQMNMEDKVWSDCKGINKLTSKLIVYPPPPAKGGISVTNEDLHCLSEGEFLNDVIIDFYLKYLVLEKLKKEEADRIHIFSSFFYKRLNQRERRNLHETSNLSIQQKRHGRVKTWTRHVDIFEKDFIFVPLNEA
ncbi:hypothetical protein HPG69_014770 [Diceros bicornis minor]|uniref:Ubiquitin-like protease family profile domain-containing protein n=1 Tax=Diceros bicornis minor TaxID=77932 RepID=A0A7J7EI17_DICBM|nr:hypothetical protein HPG69_014770 [Diceros bicornis minor]